MKITVDQLIKSFESKTQNKKERYNDFLFHCFHLFEKLIKDNKNKRNKYKYIIIRQNLINYLIVNERNITSKLCR